MKKVLLVFLFLFVCSQLSFSQTNPQYLYKLDIKTKFADKKDLEPLKNGLIAKVENSIYFKKVEFGENYSLWINNPQVKRELQPDGSKKVQYYCELELRTPAAFSKGKYITSRGVYVEYTVSREILDKIADPDYDNLGVLISDLGLYLTDSKQRDQSLNTSSNALAVKTAGISKLAEKAVNETCTIMANYFKPNDPLDFKAEYVFVGNALYEKLIEMIVEIESK